MTWVISLERLNEFAAEFWKYVNDAKVFAFHGSMGAGKTTLIAALCKFRGVTDIVSSPTFSIINEYRSKEGDIFLHIDLYRLNNREEITRAGVEDCICSNEICFVEWAEKAPDLFDENTMHIFIEPVNETVRSIKIVSSVQNKAEQS